MDNNNNDIQHVDSAPDYINKFIHLNMEQLCKIYDEGMYNNSDLKNGILFFKCSEKDNKMDVQFMNDEMMSIIIQKESLINLKNNIPENKKLFMIQDIDINSIFLIHI
tara:strand:+ start:340 stop:663 length:324 start_codon:yes stop_codon:yes gene_type:complete